MVSQLFSSNLRCQNCEYFTCASALRENLAQVIVVSAHTLTSRATEVAAVRSTNMPSLFGKKKATPAAPATPVQEIVGIRPWDYVYLRTAPLDASQKTSGPGRGFAAGDVLRGIQYQHWAIQVRHNVYDVARLNDVDNDHEYALHDKPMKIQEWERNRPSHSADKIPIGITFRSDIYITENAIVIWAAIFRGEYKLLATNCQHFAIQLVSLIHATTSQISYVPPAALATLQPLPSPFKISKGLGATIDRLKRNQTVAGATPESNFSPPKERNGLYCGYSSDFVDSVRKGKSVQDTVAVLQRLGVRKPEPDREREFNLDFEPAKLAPEQAWLLDAALKGEVRLDDVGRQV
ncbi:hypothetical protein C7974DRAFT_204206 [Boeremia exigua]|uniref:uncharacterized protein n=1 Tax=Boeremia exigua TaxID=749465 RepID=UPI001E8D4A94|nr:uncharacterized protein C7974DRAFT_204206 [Boeremia exigua]KAH6625631.1 hypothetical protein C7974DRAFT_204206 [Boeremia exigua]